MNAGAVSSMVITFHPDGSVDSMHREAILDMGFLGPKKIERATDIRFDEESQSWGLWIYDPKLKDFIPPFCDDVRGFATYEGARFLEVSWFENARWASVAPTSAEGMLMLRELRSAWLPE